MGLPEWSLWCTSFWVGDGECVASRLVCKEVEMVVGVKVAIGPWMRIVLMPLVVGTELSRDCPSCITGLNRLIGLDGCKWFL